MSGFGASSWFRRWRRSIRWRLVALFLLLAVALSAVFVVGLQRAVQAGWQGYAAPMLTDYVDRLAAEIGSPPDLARAQAIVDRLPVTVRIDGPTLSYDSRPPRRRGSWADHRHANDDDGGGDFTLSRRTADGHVIQFGLAPPRGHYRPRGPGWMTLLVLVGLTGVAYLVVRRLLSPLDAIGAGAERYGRGDFSQPIAVKRDDELADLAGRINRMADGLHGMLDAKRALLLAISHELRSPLTRARLNAELLPDSAEQSALVRDLAVMRDLIEDLMESERLATGHAALQAEPTDLAALVRELVTIQFTDGQPVPVLDLAGDLGPVSVDPARIRLLLRNLIHNALRHGSGGAQPPVVSLRRDDQGQMVISVRDFGPGVPPEHLPHLTEAFYRPDSARTRHAGGVGLGLHLCHQVAQAHGGTLTLRNASPGLEATLVI
jgi:signal transduction histidine kinase